MKIGILGTERVANLLTPAWTNDAIVDLGGIDSARGAEAYFASFATLAAALKTDAFNIQVVGSEG